MKELITTAKLEKCLHVLTPNKYQDVEIMKALLSGTPTIFSTYINPFRRELDRNMLTRTTPDEKKDLIIYYLSELMRVKGVMREFSELEIQTPKVFVGLHYKNSIKKMSNIETYNVNRHYFYALLFDEIQKCCFNFNVPFLSICKGLWFPVQVIDIEISKEYDKLKTGVRETDENMATELEKLREELASKDFYKLKLVNALSEPAREKLIWFINTNELPYQVAMLDFLGFIKYYDEEFGLSRNSIYKKMAAILSTTIRSIKGNYLVLQDYSKEDRKRYTAYKYRNQVQNDYHLLK